MAHSESNQSRSRSASSKPYVRQKRRRDRAMTKLRVHMVDRQMTAFILEILIRSSHKRNLQLSLQSMDNSNIAISSMSPTLQPTVPIGLSPNNPVVMDLLSTETKRMRFGLKRSYKGQTSMEERSLLISASEESLVSQLLGVIQVRSDHLQFIGHITDVHTLDPQAVRLRNRIKRAAGGTMTNIMRRVMIRSGDTRGHDLIPTEREDPTLNHQEDDMYPQPHQLIIKIQLFGLFPTPLQSIYLL